MSCERRLTDCEQSCESFFDPKNVVSLIYVECASQKSEDNLAIAEAELDKQNNVNQELSKKADELHAKTEESARLKDQVEEYDIPRSFFINRFDG
jgi:hypothetical protein